MWFERSLCGRLILLLAGLLVWGVTYESPAQTTNGLAYTFTTLAGKTGLGVADGIGSLAQFNRPQGVAIDRAGNLYVADTQNHTIRKITAAGVVTSLAGFPGVAGSADGLGSNARFNLPYGITVDGATNLYVTDSGNNTIRKITPSGLVSTIAGVAGNSGTNDGPDSAASFNGLAGIAVDGATNLYVADTGNNAIREITPGGVVSTITNVMSPQGIAADSAGNIYVGYALFPGGGGDPPTYHNGGVIEIAPGWHEHQPGGRHEQPAWAGGGWQRQRLSQRRILLHDFGDPPGRDEHPVGGRGQCV